VGSSLKNKTVKPSDGKQFYDEVWISHAFLPRFSKYRNAKTCANRMLGSADPEHIDSSDRSSV